MSPNFAMLLGHAKPYPTPAGTGRRITFECPDDRDDRDDTANGRPLVARVLDVLATGPATRPDLVAKLPGSTGNDISSALGALIKRGRIVTPGTRSTGRHRVNVYALVDDAPPASEVQP